MARRPVLRALLLRALFLLAPAPAAAAPEGPGAAEPAAATLRAVAALCDRAAAEAAAETGVPLDVLRAIARTETGRTLAGAFLPWPWTVNMEGKGLWFDSAAEAVAYARAEFVRGARSFDMGCFQVNYRWHGARFPSLEAMMDPLESARYAAGFLRDLHALLGDWTLAAGRYHSATPELALRYRTRYERLLASLPPLPEAGPLPLPATLPGALPAALPAVLSPAARREAAPLLAVTLPPTPGAVAITFGFRSAPAALLVPARPLPGPPPAAPAPGPAADPA